MFQVLGALSDRILPIPGGFRRGSKVYWPEGPDWVAGRVVGRRGGRVEVEYPLKSGTMQVKDSDELNAMPGGFELGDEVFHCGEPDPLVPDRASGVVKGITEEGEVMVKFPGTDETLAFEYTDLTIQEPGKFLPGTYTVAEYMQARRASKWTMVRLASRPGQVEGADLVPGTRIEISLIHNEHSRMGSTHEILGTLSPTTKVFSGQETKDLVVLQSCVDAGAPRAAVIGEPQPESWPLKTVVIWSSSGGGDDLDDEDLDEELECQILEWNGRRMQWKVQILPNGATFWADVNELIPKPMTTTTAEMMRRATTPPPSVVPSPQRPTTAEMMRRAGSLANFSPAPVGAKQAPDWNAFSTSHTSLGTKRLSNAFSTGRMSTGSRRRWRTSAERRSDARQQQARLTAKLLADEATQRRCEIRQSSDSARQAAGAYKEELRKNMNLGAKNLNSGLARTDGLVPDLASSSAGLKRMQKFDEDFAVVKRRRP